MGKSLIIQGGNFYENAIERGNEPVPYTLQQGFATASPAHNPPALNIGNLPNRVITSQLFGSYKVKTNSGYVIRAIVTYETPITIPSPTPTVSGFYATTNPALVSNVQGLTEYTLNNSGAYSIITFCKTDATQNLLPTENIVDSIIRP